jgi:ApbE superfamily uncharacterized protein (UPF0280 family)
MKLNTFKFKIDIEETKINLITDIYPQNLEDYIITIRNDIKNYMNSHPLFRGSYEPIIADENAPLIIKKMCEASQIANVGPTAALAGAISEFSRDFLIENGSKYSIVDNGGDISLINDKEVICGIYAGNSSLSGQIGFKFKKGQKLGVCSSSATVGFSASFGKSDIVSIISKNTIYADCLATSIGNKVIGKSDEKAVENALNYAENFTNYFQGGLIILNDTVGTIGDLPEIISLNPLNLDDFEEID